MFITPKGTTRRERWTTAQINRVKEQVKDELAAYAAQPKQRAAHILTRIRELEQAESAAERLACFVYIMSALVQHQRRKCLKSSQIEGLLTRAYIILQHQGVTPGASQHAFLYGELHQVRSLIYRRDGEVWRSAWEQQMAEFLARGSDAADPGFNALALGARALRLGNSAVAHREFTRAATSGLPERQAALARISAVRTLRLAGHFDAARDAAQSALAMPGLARAAELEVRWEQLCLDAMRDGDLGAMASAVQKKGAHHQAAYLVEAFFWAASVSKKEWMQRLVKMRTLARRTQLEPRRTGFMIDSALVLEECYDKDLPLALRLARLGAMLGRVKLLTNIDKEMLIWAAAARWLARIHSFKLATLALSEYEHHSLRLTAGNDPDVMRLARDLQNSAWHAEGRWPKPAESAPEPLVLPTPA